MFIAINSPINSAPAGAECYIERLNHIALLLERGSIEVVVL